MQPLTYMMFGIDRNRVALVANFVLDDRPAPGEPKNEFGQHALLGTLGGAGKPYACRMIGAMVLLMMQHTDPEAMRKHTFGAVTPAQMIGRGDGPAGPMDIDALLPIHLMLSLASDGQSLEIEQRDEQKQVVPGAGNTVPVSDLAARGADGAATVIGAIVLDTLMGLYPAVFAPYPALLEPFLHLRPPVPDTSRDTSEVAERARLLQEEKRKMAKLLDDMEKGLKPDDD
jgi:hypothetical protein